MWAKNARICVATTLLFLASASASGVLPQYEIIDLGTLGGGYSVAGDINNGGQVVGGSFTTSMNWHAFLWDMANGMTDLGTLPGHTVSGASGINDYGVIVGSSGTDTSQQAFIWDISEGMRPLAGISESEITSATYINNRGQVLGHISRYPPRAFLWDADRGVTYLGTLGGAYSGARAINNIGEAVGSSDTPANENHAFLWDAANGMRDLGTLGGPRSDAFGINDAGQVVGWSLTETAGYFHAFLWDSVHGMTDLGLGTDTAHAINDAGQVVGVAAYNAGADDGEYYAFYWDSTVGVIRLYDLLPSGCGWADLRYALDINNRGQIVGTGITNSGESHAFLMTPLVPKTIYVDPDAGGANNGSSWADAYNYIQDALMMVLDGDEIRVAQGVYRPDQFVLSDRPCRGREETFQLKNGATLKGGYAGFGEPDPNARNVKRFETILSGDLNGDDGPGGTTVSDNSRHVVTGGGTDDTAIIDGVTITAGYADGIDGDFPFVNNGAGMYNENGSPTLINCTFTQNIVVLYDYEYGGLGAAIYNLHSHPVIKNCIFRKNSTGGGHGVVYNESSSPMISDCVLRDNDGGGIEFQYETGAVVSRCRFIGNVSGYGSGVNCEYGSSPVIRDCVFIGNTAWYDGGALRCYEGCYPTVSNCIFAGNKAVIQNGGAISTLESSPTLTNCTFTANNAARQGGAVFCYAGSHPKVANCILWGNSAADGAQIALTYHQSPGHDPSTTEITVGYSNVQGGHEAVSLEERCKLNWGPGNTDANPRFVLPGFWDPNGTPENADDDFCVDGDYHLKSQAGRWNASEGRWTIDDVTSPCIDAGDPLGPIGLEPFPNGGIVNMGAYGGTAEASKSYFDKPPCELIVAGDINGDCEIDFNDFAIMALHWLENYQP
jgi:probable HAF family extracellular repeat protein